MNRRKPPARLKPRNPVAVSPLLRKGGAHQRTDKRASRARLKVRLRKDDDSM